MWTEAKQKERYELAAKLEKLDNEHAGYIDALGSVLRATLVDIDIDHDNLGYMAKAAPDLRKALLPFDGTAYVPMSPAPQHMPDDILRGVENLFCDDPFIYREEVLATLRALCNPNAKSPSQQTVARAIVWMAQYGKFPC